MYVVVDMAVNFHPPCRPVVNSCRPTMSMSPLRRAFLHLVFGRPLFFLEVLLYNILDGYPALLGFPVMHRVHAICTKGVTMHRCIAILGPAIRVSYRDPSIAILKKKKKTLLVNSALFLPFTALIMPFIFSSPR